MPAHDFAPGELFYCIVTACNPDQETYQDVPLFVFLDVFGAYFFWPSFSEFDYQTVNIPNGATVFQIIDPFDWPAGAGSANGIKWIAGMTDQAISELLGTADTWDFGWHE